MASTLDSHREDHPAGDTGRPRTPVLPHHFIGWAAVLWLLAVDFFPAYWGKLNDLITNPNAQLLTIVGALVLAVLLLWQAHFRRRDRSLLLGAVAVLTGVVGVFGLLVLLAFAGQALS